MRVNSSLILIIAASLIFINAKMIFSQDTTVKGGAIPDTQSESETQWVWGDVANLDTQNKALVVKYLDYETDQEKEISLNVDDQTAYENIKSLDEIKLKDTISVDYIVSSDGKNIARNISVERAEDLQGMQEEGSLTEEQKLPSLPPEEEPKVNPAAPQQ